MTKVKLAIAATLVVLGSFGVGVRAWAGPTHARGASEIAPAPAPEGTNVENKAEAEDEEGAPGEINWIDGLFGAPSDPKFKGQPPLGALLLNFGVLVFVYVRFGRKPLQEGLKARRDDIAKDIENAAKILSEAKKRAERYQQQLGKKDDDAASAKAGLAEAGRVEKERIIKEAEEKAARLKRDAAFLIDQEVKQRRQDLVKETVEKAIAEAEALLARGVTPADQERLAEEYLSQLGSQKVAGVS
jgi:F0F1-type ATP synthase membrane subunit b/b'